MHRAPLSVSLICLLSTLGCEMRPLRPPAKELIPASPPPPAPATLDPTPPANATKLLRYPDIHGDRVVFTYAGDLWQASAAGGTATRLTSHPGLELFAKYSPDGRSIAFTGQYDGDEQVYVIPAAGGAPRRLTFYPARGPLPARWGFDNQIYGWTPDGSKVLYRSMRDSFSVADSRLYLVPAAGGLPEALSMPVAGAGAFSPDGKRVVYSPLARDFRTWKRYQGGWAQDLYLFDLVDPKAEQITDHARSDRDPMWIGDTICFASDRDGKLNLYRYRLSDKRTEQLTRHKAWDVRWPSADAAGSIVYELNGDLYLLATPSGESRKLAIYVPDDGVARRPERIVADKNIESFGLSPGGERALVVARGEVFTLPLEHGLTRNLTRTSGVHEREAHWSADGKRIVFISDQSGEEQLWIIDQDGTRPAEQLSQNHRVRLYRPRWSPDGAHIAYHDKDGKLFVMRVQSRQIFEIADDPVGVLSDYAWSPDGKFLALSKNNENFNSSLYIWSTVDRRLRRVTHELFDEHSLAWDPGGKYLYFLSARTFQPHIGSFDWNFVVDWENRIYALALQKDAPGPFPIENDEVAKRPAKKPDKQDHGADEPPAVRIDFEGLAERLATVPMEADNYRGLVVTKTHLIYGRSKPNTFADFGPVPGATVLALAFDDKKVTEVATGVQAWTVSADGQTLLARHEKGFKRYQIGKDDKAKSDKAKEISLATLTMERVPAHEWTGMFHETWRRFRDHFYVDNMHGYDWQALRQQYQPLLAHVGHREDLNYILGEMVAELNVSHAYISGGDLGLPARQPVALPGARFELDAAAGRYRIARILAGHNAEEDYRSPLREVGVQIEPGDYVLAINGQPLTAADNPYQLLQLPAGKPVELRVNARPQESGARRVLYLPIASESSLLYLEWVLSRREQVAEASGGRIGYLHLPDMGPRGLREFIKWFYGQVHKRGLIIDVRGNGGGAVSSMLIERLRRIRIGMNFSRTSDLSFTYPPIMLNGPMVTLIDETSGSDGDLFPWAFRQAGLGPLIGKRTWGGVVGITGHGPLIDGGEVYVPEFGYADANGQWTIEGHGVEPDIEIDNDPIAVIAGRDPQLERAIQEVLARIKPEQPRLPTRPAAPVKTP